MTIPPDKGGCIMMLFWGRGQEGVICEKQRTDGDVQKVEEWYNWMSTGRSFCGVLWTISHSEPVAGRDPLVDWTAGRGLETLSMMKRSFDRILLSVTSCTGSSSTPGLRWPSELVCRVCWCQPPSGYCSSRPHWENGTSHHRSYG